VSPSAVDNLHNFLCDIHKKTKYTLEGAEWPPNQPRSIVSVALIHYRSGYTQHELIQIAAKRHREGSLAVDKLASAPSAKRKCLENFRITKDIADIFAPDPSNLTKTVYEKPKRILIEGAPGIGKTVLAKEIVYGWANNDLLTEIEVAFVLFLRDPQLQAVKSVKELIQYVSMDHFDDIQITTCVSHFVSTNGSKLCIVLDGFDEYPASLQKNSFIVDIIKGKFFSKAVVVITSRPIATASLHHQVDRRIDILGFAREEREEYISKSLKNSPKQITELENYLKLQPTINAFCYVPLHLAVLLYLFQQGSLPETLTEMNESFVIHTVYRHLEKRGLTPFGVVNKLSDLPKSVFNIVCKLSQLAFKGLQENQLVFTLDEITEVCPDINDIPGAINMFGLLQAVQHYPQRGAGKTASFNFLHYTMQEFLAAFHVSTLSDEQQSSLMGEKFWDEKFNFMWMMYVGIVGSKSQLFSHFITKGNSYKKKIGLKLSDEIQKDKRKRLHVFQCYTEAKSKTEVPDLIVSMFKNGDVKITDITLLPNHVSSLVSFLSCTLIKLKVLELKNTNCGDIGINILKQYMIDNKETTSTLEYVDLTGNNSSQWNVYCTVIKQCTVSNLTLCGDHGMEEFTNIIEDSLLTNTTLQSLTLCEIGKTGLDVVKTLKFNNNSSLHLNEINLSWKKISSKRIGHSSVSSHCKLPVNNKMVLDDSVSKVVMINILWDESSNCTPCSLDLSSQCRGDGALLIAFGLCNNTMVHKLDISNNGISDDKVSAISECLKHNIMLQDLNISCNNIGAVGVNELAQILQANITLQKLDISKNSICNDGAVAFTNCLKNNSSLQELNLSENEITNEGARRISEAIKINTTLLKLNISKNWITVEGLIVFFETLACNSVLQTLSVTHNNITVGGITKVEDCIKTLSFSLKIHVSWNELVFLNKKIAIKSTTCSFHNCNLNDTSNATDVWPLENITNPEYRAAFLCECLKEDDTLIKLDLSHSNIFNDDSISNIPMVKIIAEAIQVNTTIQKLDMSDNNIFDGGAQNLSDGLKINKSLLELNLTGNKITHLGAKDISEVIQVTTTLQKLNLYRNNIGDDGAAVISDSLKSNKSLQQLCLGANGITFKGAQKISEAFQVAVTLKKLDLGGNRIGDNGAASISVCLKFLLELNLEWNEITCVGAKKISEAIQVTTTLQKLDLYHNKIGDDGVAFISDSLKRNGSLKELNLESNDISSIGAKKIYEAIKVTKTLQKLYL